MGLFKKTEYTDELLPEVTGRKGAMVVTIKAMPYRKEVGTNKRKLHPDFGTKMMDALYHGRTNKVRYEEVERSVVTTGKYVFGFSIDKFAEMTLEISGSLTKKSVFDSDLADAIIDAWEGNQIKT